MDDDSDAPEMVTSSSVDVQRLRELHEKLSGVTGKGKKAKKSKQKRKNGDDKKQLGVDANVGLDMSILDNLDQDVEELNQELEEQERAAEEHQEDSDGEDNEGTRFKIDATSRRSTKIDHVEVTILERGDPLGSFKVSEKALEFQKSVVDAYDRKEVGGFVKNRKKRRK